MVYFLSIDTLTGGKPWQEQEYIDTTSAAPIAALIGASNMVMSMANKPGDEYQWHQQSFTGQSRHDLCMDKKARWALKIVEGRKEELKDQTVAEITPDEMWIYVGARKAGKRN